MRHTYKFLLLLLSATIFLGCSEKSFTLQSYADEYFNDKKETVDNKKEDVTSEASSSPTNVTEVVEKTNDTNTEKTNPTIKTGHGSDIAWSSTYKKDKETQGQGVLQKTLDGWFENTWSPAFEGDEEQTEADKNASKTFTLQHYVDKVGKYMKYKDGMKAGQPYKPANYEKLNKMPVIGK